MQAAPYVDGEIQMGTRAKFLGHGRGWVKDRSPSSIVTANSNPTFPSPYTCSSAHAQVPQGPAGPGQAPQKTCHPKGPHEACPTKGSEFKGQNCGKWAKREMILWRV